MNKLKNLKQGTGTSLEEVYVVYSVQFNSLKIYYKSGKFNAGVPVFNMNQIHQCVEQVDRNFAFKLVNKDRPTFGKVDFGKVDFSIFSVLYQVWDKSMIYRE